MAAVSLRSVPSTDAIAVALPASLSLATPEGSLEVDLFDRFPLGPRGTVEVQAKKLEGIDPSYRRLTEGSRSVCGSRGWFLRQQTCEGGEVIDQIVVAVEVHSIAVLATATGADLAWIERVLPRLVEAFVRP
jgi:hypothetical protein